MGDTTHMATGFGARLKELRLHAELSQAQLATRAKMNTAGVAKLEQGVREPSWATVLALAAALRVSVEAFVPPRDGQTFRQPPTPPAKIVRPGEGRLDAATALLRAVQDEPSDRTTWGVLADWLGERDLQAELYCRRRIAMLEHESRKPINLPVGRRHRDHRRETDRRWREEGAAIEREYGTVTRGGYAERLRDVLWILWGDPATTRCPRRTFPASLSSHGESAGARRLAASDAARARRPTVHLDDGVGAAICRWRGVSWECPPHLRGKAIREEGHPAGPVGGYDVQIDPVAYDLTFVWRSPAAAVADLLDAVYSPDPIASLFGRETPGHTALDLVGERRGENVLDVRRNPFSPPA
jgi:uncharacterized protein (TIGR02996 family)